jgi:hypothetical protein
MPTWDDLELDTCTATIEFRRRKEETILGDFFHTEARIAGKWRKIETHHWQQDAKWFMQSIRIAEERKQKEKEKEKKEKEKKEKEEKEEKSK